MDRFFSIGDHVSSIVVGKLSVTPPIYCQNDSYVGGIGGDNPTPLVDINVARNRQFIDILHGIADWDCTLTPPVTPVISTLTPPTGDTTDLYRTPTGVTIYTDYSVDHTVTPPVLPLRGV